MKKIMNFNIDARTRTLIYVTGGLVLAFLFQKFFLSALNVKIKNISRQIQLKEVDLKSGTAIQNKKEMIAEDYKAYKDYLKDKGSSDTDVVAKFLKEVETIAQKTQIAIVSLTPDNESHEVGGNKVFYADAKIEANLDQFYSFLNEIQNSRLLIKIDKLGISVKDEAGSALRIDATISMTAV